MSVSSFNMNRIQLVALAACLCALFAAPASAQDELLTVAETSGFTKTATSDEVLDLCNRLDEASERVVLTELGRTAEDRAIPLLIVADPPIESVEDLAESDKLVCLLFANIHAGEVCGKAGLMMLARELALADEPGVLEHVALAIVPNYNPDGNDRFGPDNRPGQHGPDGGMGERANSRGFDLNRDWIRLESEETRAFVSFLNKVDPGVVVDCHTTDGSHHRYTLTYEANRNPASDRALLEYVRGAMIPAINGTMKADHGWDTFWYGNFARQHSEWETYPASARYGTPYRGLRNRVAILSEAYAYASFEDRVRSTHDFCADIVTYAGDHADEIRKLIKAADDLATKAGSRVRNDDLVPIRSRPVDPPRSTRVLGYAETTDESGKAVVTNEPREYMVSLRDRQAPTLEVVRPAAYVIEPGHDEAIRTLQRHGVEVRELREDIQLDLETYELTAVKRGENEFQGHHLLALDARSRKATRTVPAGSFVVRTAQPLGSLAVVLLEPMCEDGLATWGLFGENPISGETWAVARLMHDASLLTAEPAALPEDRAEPKPITLETTSEPDEQPDFSGHPAGVGEWIDDRRYLQVRNGVLCRVDAVTGRARPFVDTDSLTAALAALPTLDDDAARTLASSTRFDWTPDRTLAVFNHGDDLYAARLDGSSASRLTATPQPEELARPSPDGAFVGFVRDNDLWVVDTATGTERALTAGGSDTLRRGKASWVYYEEVFGRDWRAWWWSPNAHHIAFFETDSSPVPEYTIIDNRERAQKAEHTRYPRPGEPNPIDRLGIADALGGAVRWADLGAYDPGRFIITRVTWEPDGTSALVYVQNREQTWLDVLRVETDGTTSTLFRESTRAWVEAAPAPVFLDDGSFLFLSERSGWNHIYHYSRDGVNLGAVTAGEWEVRELKAVDEKRGGISFTASIDSPIAENLYRVGLDGGEPKRLTHAPGHHSVSVSPHGRRFVDTWSDHATPSRVALFDSSGGLVRTLDANPVRALDEYTRAEVEYFTIPTDDGFELEAYTIKPPGFDPARRYPVVLLTYGGPQAPTVWDSWHGGRTFEQVLAGEGFVVFRVDPRSASRKGAVSAWSAYQRFGRAEVGDVAHAIEWLTAEPWADAERVGMHGHSFGGTMTLAMMEHTGLIAAGIAGAPVTDWRDYDSIYSERYMLTPQDNPDGYRETSAIEHAGDLSGRLMLVHGLIDDNVHAQNSVRLIQALHDAEIPFDLMVYPANRHGIWGDAYTSRRLEFFRRELHPELDLPADEPSESQTVEPEPTGAETPESEPAAEG